MESAQPVLETASGGPQSIPSGPWAYAGTVSGAHPYPSGWWAVPASERGLWAAAKLSEGWGIGYGAAASQLLGALHSIPVASIVMLVLTLYLASHVRPKPCTHPRKCRSSVLKKSLLPPTS